MHIHFVIHEAFEAPGAFETWARDRGATIGTSRVYRHEPLPASIAEIDLLVVMGGPQSPSTRIEDCPYFDSRAEQALIARCVAAGKAVIGVCLGAQLMGEALGAPHCRSPETEIGKFPIRLTPAGQADARFAHFGATLEVGHWHSDMPGLTPEAVLIADSAGCPRQIIAYGPLAYGFQCHLELTRNEVELLIAASGDTLATLTGHRFVQQPAALRANDYREMNQQLFRFLDALMQDYRARSGR